MAQAPLYAFPEAFSVSNARSVCKEGLATSLIEAVKSFIAEFLATFATPLKLLACAPCAGDW